MNKLIGSIATVALIGSPLSIHAEDPLKTDTKVIATFDSEADVANVALNNTSKTLVPSQEGQALRVKFDPATYPSIFFNQPTPSDFRGYGGLAFTIPAKAPLPSPCASTVHSRPMATETTHAPAKAH